jgi:hypothetical protein
VDGDRLIVMPVVPASLVSLNKPMARCSEKPAHEAGYSSAVVADVEVSARSSR